MTSKPYSAIRIFEKIVETILTYTCEITEAYIPKKWDLNKFQKNMWKTGEETQKVVLSFLRQLLGVHKKTTNLAILAETGKHPICLKIFLRIIKYWVRLSTSKNPLLKGALELNKKMQIQGNQNWLKLTLYLLELTKITDVPNGDAKKDNSLTTNFKKLITELFENWWKQQTESNEASKLDFYYLHKKIFRYESYLDNIPRYIRMYITKLRLSSHNLPIETMRYQKTRIDREDRKCKICNQNKTGDEYHYLLDCNNIQIYEARLRFFKNVKSVTPQLEHFSNKNIIDYTMSMSDKTTQYSIATFAKDLQNRN